MEQQPLTVLKGNKGDIMKSHIYAVLAFVLYLVASSFAFNDEVNADPCPTCNHGFGCLTDSECEGIK